MITTRIKLTTASLLLAVLSLTACTGPSPEAYLVAAVAAIDIASALPGLTPNDRLWLTTAAGDAACSSDVLARGEPIAKETVDIAACWATLPVVTPADNVYIAAAIAAVEIFIALYEPSTSMVAISANAKVHGMNTNGKSVLASKMSEISAKSHGIQERIRQGK